MASQPRKFVYSPAQLASLERTLSCDRLLPYVIAAQGNQEKAVRLYEHNTGLSESLYGMLQGTEVAVRNSMHAALATGFHSDHWYDILQLEFQQQSALDQAKSTLLSQQKALDPGRIVAELSFGFWTGLTGPSYSNTVWVPYLHRAFPHKSLGRKLAHARLDRIRKLRNRVAHHEPILKRNLWTDFQEILELVGWICPDTALWIAETTGFPVRHKQYQLFVATL